LPKDPTKDISERWISEKREMFQKEGMLLLSLKENGKCRKVGGKPYRR
jgi:hypothetical protein